LAKRPLTPEDIFNLKCFGDVQLSPDGKTVAYVRQLIDKDKDKALTDIFLVDIDTKITRRLTNSGKDHSPRWSPDGKKLAFISSRSQTNQIWIIDTTGGEAWRIPTREQVQGPPVWSPDGRRIFYIAKTFSKSNQWVPYPGCPEDDRKRAFDQAKRALKFKSNDRTKQEDNSDEKKVNDIKVITRLRYRMDGIGYFGDLRKQVFHVPIPESPPDEKEVLGIQLTSGDYDHERFAVSLDGQYIVVSALRRDDADYHLKQDLWLFELETSNSYLLYDAPGPASFPNWSQDGKYIAFLGHDNARNVSTRTDLYVLRVDEFIKLLETGKTPKPLTLKDAVNLTGHLDRQAGRLIGSDIRYRGGSPLAWDGNIIYFALVDHGTSYIYRAVPEDSKNSWYLEKILGSEDQAISGFSVRKGTIAFQSSTPVQPENIYVLEPQPNGPEKALQDKDTRYVEKRLTSENDAFISEICLGSWEKFRYYAKDGQELDGWLIYPAGFSPEEVGENSAKKNKVPLVVLVHGGPHGAYGSAFMFGAQLFASRGYAVAYFNPRGSISYGQEFMACIDGDWGNKDYGDIMAGVDAVLAKGLIDEKNMFVHGWSYGGYMTTWIVTQTGKFKAACAGASVCDLHSDYGTSDIMWADEHEYGGKPWEKADLLLDRSPLSHVAKVTTPILLLHGENDMRCPIIQSEEFYVALRRLGKTAVFVRYPGEFHGLKRPLHRVDRYKRLISWFEYYRKNPE